MHSDITIFDRPIRKKINIQTLERECVFDLSKMWELSAWVQWGKKFGDENIRFIEIYNFNVIFMHKAK